MIRDSRINPLTCEPEPRGRARFCNGAIVVRLSESEAEALDFAQARGYLPRSARVLWRDDRRPALRILRADAYAWAEEVEEDPDAFCACLARPLAELLQAADFRIRDGWAV